jgi:hypothetical protein
VRALFRNPGFGKGWLSRENVNAMLKSIRSMNEKSGAEIPYPFGAFTSLLGSRGFFPARLPDIQNGAQGLGGIEMARYFDSLIEERHPNDERQ